MLAPPSATCVRALSARRVTGHCAPGRFCADKIRGTLLPPSVPGPKRGTAATKAAQLNSVTQAVDIPLRTLDSAAGRQAFNFPTKAAPAKGGFGTVWLACFDTGCPCAAGGFACRGSGATECVDKLRCTCYVTFTSKVSGKTGAEALTIHARVQKQGLAGALGAHDAPAPGSAQPPPPAEEAHAVVMNVVLVEQGAGAASSVPGRACTEAVRAA